MLTLSELSSNNTMTKNNVTLALYEHTEKDGNFSIDFPSFILILSSSLRAAFHKNNKKTIRQKMCIKKVGTYICIAACLEIHISQKHNSKA